MKLQEHPHYPPQSEKDLQKLMAVKMENWGWDVSREVVVDGTDNYRADIVAEHEKWGLLGLECKSRLDSVAARRAARQIATKYRDKRYGGKKINRWAIACYNHKYFNNIIVDDKRLNTYATALSFVTEIGIGWIDFDPCYPSSRTEFSFVAKFDNKTTEELTIPVAGRSELIDQVDLRAIDNKIRTKRRLWGPDLQEAEIA